ncbi:MAG: hypothetical protein KJO35_05215, partial [Gammaproteobacteria bacterium]|nr:hypothetical protein [Gammaproteobacteria bacterium]
MNSIRLSLILALSATLSACASGSAEIYDRKQAIDLLVRADYVLPMTDEGLIKDGAVAIHDGEIVDVGPADELLRRYR